MNKKILIIAVAIIAIFALTLFVVKKNTEMLIQGEVDTKNVDLSSKITGRVKKIYVKKGDYVKEGQLLISLDTPDIAAKSEQSSAALDLAEAQRTEVDNGTRYEQKAMALDTLRQAQAGLELASKTYKRMNRLNKEGVIANQKLDEVSAQYKSAQKAAAVAQSNYQMAINGARYEDKLSANANVRRAAGAVKEVRSYLNENEIRSPISGQITDIPLEEGELVGAGYPIITVVNLLDNWVVFNLREDLLSHIQMGTLFDVKIPAISDKPIKVKVNFISAMGNYATWRATKVRGDFDLKTFEVHAVPVKKTCELR